MSSISFQCTSCDGDFDLVIAHLLERPESIKCPHCNARPNANRASAFAHALYDLCNAISALRTKVRFELNLESDLLPPPWGPSEGEEGQSSSLGGLSALSSVGDDDDDFDDDDEDFDDDDDEEEDFFDDDDFDEDDFDDDDDDLDEDDGF